MTRLQVETTQSINEFQSDRERNTLLQRKNQIVLWQNPPSETVIGMKSLFLFLIALSSLAQALEHVYVGTAGREKPGAIYVCDFADGKLSKPRLVTATGANTRIELSPDQTTLFACRASLDDRPAELISFQRNAKGGLKEINRTKANVAHFCSLTISDTKLLGASYNDGVASSFAIEKNGSIGPQLSRLELPRFPKGKRTLARAHDVEITKSGRFAFVPDISNNRIYTLKIDPSNGSLSQSGFVTSGNFQGPRHLILNQEETCLYTLCQTGSNIVAFRHQGEGSLTEFQSISTLPSDYQGKQNHSAEILIHPSGKHLYASNRVHNSLVVFSIDASGALTKTQSISSGGEMPWSFVFDTKGTHLICSNLKSNNLVVFKIDPTSGQLTRQENQVTVPEPISLAIAPAAK